MNNITTFSFPTTIHYGPNAVTLLPEIVNRNQSQAVILVTDQEIIKLPLFTSVLQQLKESKAKINVFSEVGGNPVKSQVEAGVRAFRDADADLIVALGGGAALDVAKAIAVMVYHPGDLFDYEDVAGAKPIDQRLPAVITIPTTAGTGSEVGRSAVISDDVTKVKKIIFSPRLMPQVALIDPLLSLNLPATITAATGIDAITHLIEAYLAKGYHPQCDGIALSGLRLASTSLPQCFQFAKNGMPKIEEHIHARGQMLNAAFMGAVAFQKGLGANHSCAHALSTVNNLHHGLANAIMLPFVMRFNRESVPDRFEDFENFLGLRPQKGEAFIAWLEKLNHELEISPTLKDVGVKSEDVEKLVDFAFRDGCHSLNPREVTRADFHSYP